MLACVIPDTLLWEIGNSSLDGPGGYGYVRCHLKDSAVSGRPTHKVSLLLYAVSRTLVHTSDPLITRLS